MGEPRNGVRDQIIELCDRDHAAVDQVREALERGEEDQPGPLGIEARKPALSLAATKHLQHRRERGRSALADRIPTRPVFVSEHQLGKVRFGGPEVNIGFRDRANLLLVVGRHLDGFPQPRAESCEALDGHGVEKLLPPREVMTQRGVGHPNGARELAQRQLRDSPVTNHYRGLIQRRLTQVAVVVRAGTRHTSQPTNDVSIDKIVTTGYIRVMRTLASASQVPDQAGRTIVITGANSGIGRAAAAALAAKGARLILAIRDLDRGRAAAETMSGQVELRPLDLASLASIRDFAAGIDGAVHVLINNAGTMTDSRQHTVDGFELQLGTNHLGHFALTNLLLNQITDRVVTISSTAYRSASIDFDDLQWERHPYKPFGAYGQSKLANLLFTAELQRRLTAVGSSVLATAASPGWASTGFRITSGNRLLDAMAAISTRLLAQGPEGGALPTLLAAVGDLPGASFVTPSRFGGLRGPAAVAELSAAAKDLNTAARLWEVSEHLTETHFPLTSESAAPDPATCT